MTGDKERPPARQPEGVKIAGRRITHDRTPDPRCPLACSPGCPWASCPIPAADLLHYASRVELDAAEAEQRPARARCGLRLPVERRYPHRPLDLPLCHACATFEDDLRRAREGVAA